MAGWPAVVSTNKARTKAESEERKRAVASLGRVSCWWFGDVIILLMLIYRVRGAAAVAARPCVRTPPHTYTHIYIHK